MSKIELGVASSATQIESRNIKSSWHNFAHVKNNIKNKDDISNGIDHLNNITQDIELLKELNIKHYRMSIEWAAIEENKDIFNEEVINKYIYEIIELTKNKINVMVCFHHFTNPIWFEELGGFSKKANIIYFTSYVKKMVGYLKDYVSEYLTFNEPSIYSMQSYFLGIWPPLIKSFKLFKIVIKNMSLAHNELYQYIHDIYQDKKVIVSFAHSYSLIQGYKNNILGILISKYISKYLNDYVLKRFFRSKKTKIKGSSIDFIGLNYYSTTYIKWFKFYDNKELTKTDMNWYIYPEGIVVCAKRMLKFAVKPIFITENGIATEDCDKRINFINLHIKKLLDSNLDVSRYYYWTLIDNFEWLEGYTPKFGLVSFDMETKERTIKKSGIYYKNLEVDNLNSNDKQNYSL